MPQYIFTIFTPVYNNRNTIHRVWESLLEQTFKDFEWIIVDDGSTDDVLPLLNSYKEKATFPVSIIVHKRNLGKHFAWNKAVKIAKGEFFVPADSDDAFVPKTLERFYFYWNTIPKQNRKNFSGINVLCMQPENNSIIGEPFPESPMVTNNLELSYKYKLKGEKWGMIRTDVLREVPFPEIEGRGAYPLGYAWKKIARKYNNLAVNETLRYYYQDSGNQITHVHSKKKKKAAPVNFHYACWDLNNNLDYKIKYLRIVPTIKSFVNLWRYGLLLDNKPSEIINKMKGPAKFLAAMFFVPSYAIYQFTYKKLK